MSFVIYAAGPVARWHGAALRRPTARKASFRHAPWHMGCAAGARLLAPDALGPRLTR